MGTALFQSNSGYFNITTMIVGDTIGTAYLMANGGNISINTFLIVSSIISSSQAIISPCSWVNGCLGSFTITNSLTGGIEILSQSVPDGNNFTEGNMSSITFQNLFVNPCVPLIFTSIINSELGDVDTQTITFYPTSLINYYDISDVSIYPNPSDNIFNVEFTSILRKDIQLRIINSNGDVIYIDYIKNHIGKYNNSISLEKYSKGIYLFEVQSNDKIVSKKLILQ
jgi:hypothetical protein